MKKNRTYIAVMFYTSLLAGCQWHRPPSLQGDGVASLVAQKTHLTISAQQPLPTKPMDVAEAVARGMLYNVDYYTQAAQLAQTAKSLAKTPYRLFPQAYANGNFRYRTNYEASVARRVTPSLGDTTVEHFTAVDNGRSTGAIEATWSLLDLGLSGLEQHIKTLDHGAEIDQWKQSGRRLGTDITRAYWRLMAHQRHHKTMPHLTKRVEAALATAAKASQKPEERMGQLFYMREMTDLYRYLLALERALADAPANFHQLLNLPQHVPITLAPTQRPAEHSRATPKQWIELALLNRPEFANAYRALQKEELDGKRQIVRLLPSVTAFLGINLDSNSFTLNANWLEAGVRGSWNFLQLLQAPKLTAKAKDRAAQKRLLIEGAANLLAQQSIIAIVNHRDAVTEMRFAEKALQTQQNIVREIARQVQRKEQEERFLIKEEIMLALAAIRRDLAKVELETARAHIAETHGIGPTRQTAPSNLAGLKKALTEFYNHDNPFHNPKEMP